MKIIKEDRQGKEQIIDVPDNGDPAGNVDNQLELLKYVTQIQSRVRQNITSDFVLAKLNPKDKEYITEMTGNAYFTMRIMQSLKQNAVKYIWIEEKNMYKEVPMDKKELEIIQMNMESIFDSYMTKIYMIVNLNRNVEKNYLVRLLTRGTDVPEEISEPEQIEDRNWMQRQMDKMGGQQDGSL